MPGTPIVSIRDCVAALNESRLVTREQLTVVLTELKSEGVTIVESPLLVQRLIDRGLLTPWQSECLMQGARKDFFLGRYRLLSTIGSGGMGEVYLAQHIHMRRRVAIKLLSALNSQDMKQLFLREAQAVAALDHPNIVRAHDYDCDDRVPYLVMEYVEGNDLLRVVEEKGPLPFAEAAEYIRQAADGLQHAHEQGMVHRDVKPANLLLHKGGAIKILDMGLAKITSSTGDQKSIAGGNDVLGTADYMAPEQAVNSHNVDARADLYSLGCTFYFLLTGHPPFPEGTLAQRMMQHLTREPKPIVQERRGAPPPLAAICERMMAKKPEGRFQTAAEVSAALGVWLQQKPQESTGNPKDSAVRRDATFRDTVYAAMDTAVLKPLPSGAEAQGIECSACGSRFEYDPALVGQVVECSECTSMFTVAPLAMDDSTDEEAAGEDAIEIEIENLQFVCPNCSKRYPAKPEMAGRRVRCACGHKFSVTLETESVRGRRSAAAVVPPPAAGPPSVPKPAVRAPVPTVGAPAVPAPAPVAPAPAPPAKPENLADFFASELPVVAPLSPEELLRKKKELEQRKAEMAKRKELLDKKKRGRK